MQNRIGKRERFKITQGVGRDSYACFTRVSAIILSLLLFMSSCSTVLVKKKLNVKGMSAFEYGMSRFCFSGEGKGKIQFLTERYVVAYEAFLSPGNNRWSLGLQIPMHGEEIIKFDFEKAFVEKPKVSGALYRRFIKSMRSNQNGKHRLRLMGDYLKEVSIFLKFYSDYLQDKTVAGKCLVTGEDDYSVSGECFLLKGHKSFVWKMDGDKFVVTLSVDSHRDVLFEASDESKGYFKRIRILLNDKNEIGEDGYPIQLNLYVKACE